MRLVKLSRCFQKFNGGGMKFKTKINKDRKDRTRDCDICTRFRSGQTMTAVGECYSISRERVRQILARYGLMSLDGGAHVLKLERDRKAAVAQLQKHVDRYGSTPAEFGVIRKKIGMKKITYYRTLRAHTLKGKPPYKKWPWEITLKDYVDVWAAAGLEVQQKGFRFCRIDKNKGFVKGNLHIESKKDFGHWFGVTHGFVAHPENARRRKKLE